MRDGFTKIKDSGWKLARIFDVEPHFCGNRNIKRRDRDSKLAKGLEDIGWNMAGGAGASVGDARNKDENAIRLNLRPKISTDVR